LLQTTHFSCKRWFTIGNTVLATNTDSLQTTQFRQTQKLLMKTESLSTQKSSTQPPSLLIQKSAVAMESFQVSLLPFGQT
jgi:hypothetical protein